MLSRPPAEKSGDAVFLDNPGPARCGKRRGVSAVEMAAVASVFFLLIFGIIEVGRAFMVTHLLANAARYGCRTAILSGKANSDISTVVDAFLNKQGFSTGYTTTVKVNSTVADASTAQSEDQITVVVSIPAANVTWLPVPKYLNGSLTGQYSLRRE